MAGMSTSTRSPDMYARPVSPAKTASAVAKRGIVLVVLLAAQFMSLVDAAVVNVAGPTIQRDLHASNASLQLIISSYILSLAMMLVTGARLGDEHGHRRIFLLGVVGFTVMSMLCGLAPNAPLLIAARLLQGLTAGLMVPQSMSIIQRQFEGADRERAVALFALSITLGFIVGQVLGGVLVQHNVLGTSWRIIFFINLPVGVALSIAGLRYLPHLDQHARAHIDVIGIALLSVASVALVLPLIIGREVGWPAWTFVSMASSFAVLFAFVRTERRLARNGRQPLLDVELFGNRQFSLQTAALFMAITSYASFLFVSAVFFQSGLHLSPARAGLAFVPLGAAFGAGSMAYPRLKASVQRVLFRIGLPVAALSFVGIAICEASVAHPLTFVVLLFVPFGLGLGVTNAPLIARITTLVAPEKAPSASGIITTTSQLAQVGGLAAFGTVFFSAASHGNFEHGAVVTSLSLAAWLLVGSVLVNRVHTT